MMFATLVHERDPVAWPDVPGMIETWAQVLGGFSALAIVLWMVVTSSRRPTNLANDPVRSGYPAFFRLSLLGMLVGYGLWAVLEAPVLVGMLLSWVGSEPQAMAPLASPEWLRYCLDLGGAS